ncbi:hypothetical protein [Yinghuangia soli]|uniref:Amidotransferase n=1 Tax=Yinghuangia soli TaxID=2908204 RepID=A0AA41U439_9ACTN|nr:hypothetical protein [Yinghuangia soli]MCF2530402.1 hypothetical protein [Yinghuangia soli]
MGTLTVVFIALGLFLIGGVISFAKQGMPKGVIVLLGLCAAMSLAAGLLRI